MSRRCRWCRPGGRYSRRCWRTSLRRFRSRCCTRTCLRRPRRSARQRSLRLPRWRRSSGWSRIRGPRCRCCLSPWTHRPCRLSRGSRCRLHSHRPRSRRRCFRSKSPRRRRAGEADAARAGARQLHAVAVDEDADVSVTGARTSGAVERDHPRRARCSEDRSRSWTQMPMLSAPVPLLEAMRLRPVPPLLESVAPPWTTIPTFPSPVLPPLECSDIAPVSVTSAAPSIVKPMNVPFEGGGLLVRADGDGAGRRRRDPRLGRDLGRARGDDGLLPDRRQISGSGCRADGVVALVAQDVDVVDRYASGQAQLTVEDDLLAEKSDAPVHQDGLHARRGGRENRGRRRVVDHDDVRARGRDPRLLVRRAQGDAPNGNPESVPVIVACAAEAASNPQAIARTRARTPFSVVVSMGRECR